jgi:hypothetical protein
MKGRTVCRSHGGKAGRPRTHGLYALIDRPRIQELLDAAAALQDPLDLLPHVLMLQSLTVDFVNRYDEFTYALIAWHGSYSKEYQEALRDWHEIGRHQEEDEPDPVGYGKPSQVLDVAAASTLIDKCGAMVERIHKRQDRESISIETFNLAIDAYATTAALAIRELVDDVSLRAKLGRAVDERTKLVLKDILTPGGKKTGAVRS